MGRVKERDKVNGRKETTRNAHIKTNGIWLFTSCVFVFIRGLKRAPMATSYSRLLSPDLFPRAEFYTWLGRVGMRQVGERETRARRFPWSERHLQCVWFDSELRPAGLKTASGEDIVVEDPGVWNSEAGPDFLGAAIRIGPGRRRIAADVEIHLHPADWERHGHGSDPQYAKVRIHVTYFPGTLPDGHLSPGSVQIALKDALAANPLFSFENIDVTTYPQFARATPTPCSQHLCSWTPDEKTALLQSAGEERLRRKSERLAAAIEEKGAAQVLYEEVLCALGYKQNKAPFRRLAELVPLESLREEARDDLETAYALLMGVSGLLPKQPKTGWDAETKSFIRELWDLWWKKRERWENRIMPAGSWQLAGLRPANRPERRLMAAADLFVGHRIPELSESFVARAQRWLESAEGIYWDRRLSFSGVRQKQSAALLGETRIDAILNNVLIPFLAAHGIPPARWLDRLPVEADNAIVRQTALSLFGPDVPPSLCRDGLRQQGLIQIFHDFCLNDRSRCADCGLADLLRRQVG